MDQKILLRKHLENCVHIASDAITRFNDATSDPHPELFDLAYVHRQMIYAVKALEDAVRACEEYKRHCAKKGTQP